MGGEAAILSLSHVNDLGRLAKQVWKSQRVINGVINVKDFREKVLFMDCLWTSPGSSNPALGGEGHPNPTLAFPIWEAEGAKPLLWPSPGAKQQRICYNSFPL